MSEYLVWDYLHILMFVFWLGTDMGVFVSAKKSTDPRLTPGTRLTLLTMALRIELVPRTMWKFALPLGVMLSRELDLLEIGPLALTLIWLFSIAWWAISVGSVVLGEKPVGPKLYKLNNVLIGIVGVSLVAVAVASAMGRGPFDADATWLLWKVGLYGVINLMIIVMLVVFEPMGPAFGQLITSGSSPDLERTISSVMNRSIVTIWSTYILIAVVALIGTTRLLG